jgi:drug/metabolite transporter (DMT)-like permease
MAHRERSSAFTIVLLAAGMALFGSATPISKLVGKELPIFTASALRVALGALTLLPFVISGLRHDMAAIARRDWLVMGLIALFGMAGFTSFLFLGMKLVSGVAGSIVMSFTPALTALAAYLFLGAALGTRRLAAVALGVAGVAVMAAFRSDFGAGSDGGDFLLGVILVFAAICCEASYTLLGKTVTRRVDPVLTAFLGSVLSLPLFLALAATEIGRFHPGAVSTASWLALAWWGIGTLGAGSALWYSGVARSAGTTAAGFMAVMPASALILSYALLGEPFHALHLVGIGLVMGSVGIMSWVHAEGESH